MHSIVLSANDQFSPYLGVMVKSIIENASSDRNYDLIVLFNDISEKNRKLILGMAKNKRIFLLGLNRYVSILININYQ